VSTKSIGKIESTLDSVNIKKKGANYQKISETLRSLVMDIKKEYMKKVPGMIFLISVYRLVKYYVNK